MTLPIGFKASTYLPSPVLFLCLCIMILRVTSDLVRTQSRDLQNASEKGTIKPHQSRFLALFVWLNKMFSCIQGVYIWLNRIRSKANSEHLFCPKSHWKNAFHSVNYDSDMLKQITNKSDFTKASHIWKFLKMPFCGYSRFCPHLRRYDRYRGP